MKLITKSSNMSYLHTLKALLDNNGIPAIIFSMYLPSLWIQSNEQFEDALKLISNYEYSIINKIDERKLNTQDK